MELELDFDPAGVCRICLSSTNKLLNIFSSTVVDGYLTAVPHMISHCLDIQVCLVFERADFGTISFIC